MTKITANCFKQKVLDIMTPIVVCNWSHRETNEVYEILKAHCMKPIISFGYLCLAFLHNQS